jgi:hypothetical protein
LNFPVAAYAVFAYKFTFCANRDKSASMVRIFPALFAIWRFDKVRGPQTQRVRDSPLRER